MSTVILYSCFPLLVVCFLHRLHKFPIHVSIFCKYVLFSSHSVESFKTHGFDFIMFLLHSSAYDLFIVYFQAVSTGISLFLFVLSSIVHLFLKYHCVQQTLQFSSFYCLPYTRDFCIEQRQIVCVGCCTIACLVNLPTL